MGKKTLRKKHWHHRVPDFKLVYCGTKKPAREEPKDRHKKRLEAINKNAG